MRLVSRIAIALLLAVMLAACGPANNTDGNVNLQFALRVKDMAAACGTTYPGLGSSGMEASFSDLRLYVSNIRLINAQGQEVALELAQDGVWQYKNVALLDFEDGTGGCTDGNAQMNSVVKGTVPAGRYTSVTFDVGVPFELNHADVTAAPSPLNVQALWWNWQGGYKFIRIDLQTGAGAAGGMGGMNMSQSPMPTMDMSATAPASQGEMAKEPMQPTSWFIHLGSTGCQANDRTAPPAAPCSNPNTIAVKLDNFAPGSSVIVADLSTFLAGVPINENTPEPPGCMSGPKDPDCPKLFTALGLDLLSGKVSGAQQLFRLDTK